jgi:hypothetical protein
VEAVEAKKLMVVTFASQRGSWFSNTTLFFHGDTCSHFALSGQGGPHLRARVKRQDRVSCRRFRGGSARTAPWLAQKPLY